MEAECNWPLKVNQIRSGKVNHTFGPVRRDINGRVKNHQGWDLKAKIGTPCYAIGDGGVVATGQTKDYGKWILVRFWFGTQKMYALYAHLSEFRVMRGDPVTDRTVLGLTGDSGNAKGLPEEEQHLHFEIRDRLEVGKGLSGRLSPMEVYHMVPLKEPEYRK